MPLLQMHEMSGSFARNSSIWSLSVSPTVSGARSAPVSSFSKIFVTLMFSRRSSPTSFSRASGSIADIGPFSQRYEFLPKSCAVIQSVT